jgi:hypothetical protein
MKIAKKFEEEKASYISAVIKENMRKIEERKEINTLLATKRDSLKHA